MQVGYAIFGDHVANQPSRCNYARTGAENRNDSRDPATLCCGRNGDNRFPSLGSRRAAKKIDLSADTTVKLIADRIRANLSSEINLQCRVYRYHIVIACNQSRIVSVCCRVELKYRVVIHKFKYLFRAQHKTDNDFARLVILTCAVNYTFFDQRNDGIRYQFAVNA